MKQAMLGMSERERSARDRHCAPLFFADSQHHRKGDV